MIREALKELEITAENNVYIGDKKIESTIVKMVIKKISEKVKNKRSARGK